MLFSFFLCAWAQDWVTNISDPYELPSGGTWNRPFSTPDGWKIFLGGSAMRVADLKKEDNTWTATNIRVISDQDGVHFNDHAVKKCPDGTFLHVASRDVSVFNDSAHVWRYDTDFSILSSEVWEEESPERQYNDPSILCSRITQGVASSTRGGPMDFGNHYFSVDETGQRGELVVLADYPRMNGGALFADDLEERIYGLGMSHGQPLQINTYDAQWNVLSEKTLSLLEEYPDRRAYWPQAVIQVGDYFVVGFMGRDDSWGNGDLGDVFLAIFDLDWNLLKEYPITNYGAPEAMRPWLSRQGDQVLVGYDADLKFFIVELTLDLEAFGLTGNEPDTGMDPTLWNNNFTSDGNEGCSCGGGNAGAWILLLGLMPFLRRESGVFENRY